VFITHLTYICNRLVTYITGNHLDMRARINIITLAVDNLERALKFYRDGLRFPTKGIVEGFSDHVLFEMENGLSLVLFLRSETAKLANQPEHQRSAAESVLSYFAASKEEVEDILARVRSAGGSLPRPPEDQPWGYTAYFQDPDGHLWEILYGPSFSVS
jgi:predicted lactoylglutathione lyase